MQRLRRTDDTKRYPEKILQIGEGNFLRGFADWVVFRMNESIGYNSGVVIVQPRAHRRVDPLNEQDGLFTVRLTGVKDGAPSVSHEIVDCVTRGINPYDDFAEFMAISSNPGLEVVLSNTTEAGIAFEPSDSYTDQPPSSFPGKLALFLHKRYETFGGDIDKGLVILPLELIEGNADTLKAIVLRYAELWRLGNDFTQWVNDACEFCNTLVDRIVTGYPADSIDEIQDELGYEDRLLVEGEQFHLWAIDASPGAQRIFPADKAGLNVIFTNDLPGYRRRKVRILNGAHTSMTVIGLTAGIETVGEAIGDELLGPFIERTVYAEIVPTLGDTEEIRTYAGEILNRFRNPYIKHYLSAISLNSVSKYKARILPTLLDYVNSMEGLPDGLVLALAALIRLYKGELRGEKIELKDDALAIDKIQSVWQNYDNNLIDIKKLVSDIIEIETIWGMDLSTIPGLVDKVTGYLSQMDTEDPSKGLREILRVEIKHEI